MEIDLSRYDDLASRGRITQRSWGDGHESASLMTALVRGAESERDCVAAGWPQWLAELATELFALFPADQAVERGRRVAGAIADADAASVDWDEIYAGVRLDAILPVALESIGDGSEAWRIACRYVVNDAISKKGRAPDTREAERASKAARTAEAAAAGAAWAVIALRSVEASDAARSAEAVCAVMSLEASAAADAAMAVKALRAAGAKAAIRAAAARAAARDRIEAALLDRLAFQ